MALSRTTSEKGAGDRQPVSRVLSVHDRSYTGRSFLSAFSHPNAPAAYPRLDALRHPLRDGPSLAAYLALLRLGFALPLPLPPTRWALTPPFHPYRHADALAGRRSVFCCTVRHAKLTPRVPRRYLATCPVEPGLSSAFSACTDHIATVRPTTNPCRTVTDARFAQTPVTANDAAIIRLPIVPIPPRIR